MEPKHNPSFDELKQTYSVVMDAAVNAFNRAGGGIAPALFIADIRGPGHRVGLLQMPDEMLLPLFESDDRNVLVRNQAVLSHMIRGMLNEESGPQGLRPNAVLMVNEAWTVASDSLDRTGKPRELSEWEGAREVILCQVHTLHGTYHGRSDISGEPKRATFGPLLPHLMHGPLTMTETGQQRTVLH